MNGDIKFRAWDKYKKTMHYEAEKTFDSFLGPDILPDSFGELLEDPNYIVEQYTGVKDHVGTEIYEGDIGENEIGRRFEVVFKDGAFMLLGDGEYTDIKWAPVFLRFVVTGNIHEGVEE